MIICHLWLVLVPPLSFEVFTVFFLVFTDIITKLLIIALFKQAPTPETKSGLGAAGYAHIRPNTEILQLPKCNDSSYHIIPHHID